MRKPRYQSGMAELFFRRNVWMTVALVMTLANAAEAYFLITRTAYERHHLVPPNMEAGFAFSGERYSHDYWERLGTWLAGLALTYTPATFEYQATTFLRHVHPEAYGTIKAKLVREKKKVDRRSQTQVFYVRGVKVRGKEVAIDGVLTTRIGGREVDTRKLTYLAAFDFLPGGPVALKRFEEVDSNDPFGTEADA